MNGPLILLVGEEAEALAPRLEASGYRTAPVGALPDPPAAVLVSGADGVATIPTLRMILEDVPILLDLVSDSVEARSRCFSSGADDFWLSSAGGSDLLMRLRLHLQIRGGNRDQLPPLQLADLHLDPASRQVRRGRRLLALTAREYQLLLTLMRQPGMVLSREQILAEVWNDQGGAASNVVEVYVRYLRQKLEEQGEQRLIHTVRGRGYCLCERPPKPERPAT
ncbi:response regulator transcription factor [Synechococcus sp. Cruz-9H2]|uniref:winged helix-turn-helix transcriptional regulator n=1 Tax=unclassified Synechococcus TaxID=2626047 RepID=UPI0020CD9603|nr:MULTISPECIES: response regulator transcription factor [unclassified Synechococcus]MCP9819224.1 response regulator transcription factor [Synechococcus sp. Cruz-9H2]MCP9843728.1 response regulator transcription factor [Synechococcus sp. Edmonson 11F2]MCP9855553.1 response regulator transcription factor [Synechococcus sp. Cruz-9C9]MCP9862991.1 response regulator transcription factor [Synechococcus sp. Cruz-7E5]MCP9870134.1 response regulator transcription factor [Synechococcus sp. Cruz-7B9]